MGCPKLLEGFVALWYYGVGRSDEYSLKTVDSSPTMGASLIKKLKWLRPNADLDLCKGTLAIFCDHEKGHSPFLEHYIWEAHGSCLMHTGYIGHGLIDFEAFIGSRKNGCSQFRN